MQSRGNLSLKGEIVNALPDRFSDVFMLAGILFSPLCPPALAMAAMASTLLVSYSGMLGKALGVQWQHQGPLGKVERLILIMVACLLEYLRATLGWREWSVAGYAVAPIEMAMVLFVLLGPVTIFNRTRGMLRQIARLEWRQKLAASPPPLRVLVAYDSLTGNTEKVAAALAESLHADLRRVEQVRDVRMYDLVVVGSPVISSKPTAKVAAFLSVNAGLPYALFMTYGAPVIGRGKARKALARCAELAGSPPLASFLCKGRHSLVNTYRNHPDDEDLLSAFIFGIRLITLARNVDHREPIAAVGRNQIEMRPVQMEETANLVAGYRPQPNLRQEKPNRRLANIRTADCRSSEFVIPGPHPRTSRVAFSMCSEQAYQFHTPAHTPYPRCRNHTPWFATLYFCNLRFANRMFCGLLLSGALYGL